MPTSLDWWNTKHHKYASEDWIDKPSIFAQWSIKYFPKNGKILELGAGHGQDSRYFSENGYEVLSTDFSDSAIKFQEEKLPESLKNKISIKKIDLSASLPLEDSSYDIIYSHLSAHYFNDATTTKLFNEIYRVLKLGGIFVGLFNSINDSEYGTGTKLEQDYFELSPGDVKHFFSIGYVKEKTRQFKTIVLDDHGTTYKDNVKGNSNLIRFIGEKL